MNLQVCHDVTMLWEVEAQATSQAFSAQLFGFFIPGPELP